MAPGYRFNILGRNNNKEPPLWTDDGILPKPRDPKTMSKAERLLGVGDGSGAQAPRKFVSPIKKPNAFASAFSDLRGVLGHSSSNSRSSSQGQGTPSSPAVKTTTTDSDSITSMTSPTFDATGSTSTLPSYYDPPLSPYFSTHNSSGPSSPHDFDFRQDYHTAIALNRNKLPFETEMPAISEIFDPQEERHTGLPPLEKPALDPNPPSSPRSRSSFVPVNRLRSPSSTSVTTESTAKGKWLGWRQSRITGKDLVFEQVIVPPAGNRLNNSFTTTAELQGSSRHSDAVEAWLARADLERRPSVSSVMTKSTVPQSTVGSLLSPSSSQLSVRTLTTQKDSVLGPPLPSVVSRPLRHSKSSDDIMLMLRPKNEDGVTRAGGFYAKDLLVESFLDFSSSEDEDSDAESEQKPTKRASKRVSLVRSATATGVTFHISTRSQDSTSTSTLKGGHRRSKSLAQQSSPARSVVKQVIPVSPPRDGANSRQSFQSIEWHGSDATELGNVCIATAAKLYPAKTDGIIEIPSKRPSIVSQVSPTSKVMVISKKEEKLLEIMRQKKLDSAEKANFERSERGGETNAAVTPKTDFQLSPPRRKKNKPKALEGTDEMARLDENRVIHFPSPPTPKTKSKAFTVNPSNEDIPDLPEVVPDTGDKSEVHLPSIILSPYTESRLSSTNMSAVSEPFIAGSDDQSSVVTEERVPSVPGIPSELYGSVPDLTEVLHTGLGQRNSTRARSRASTRSMLYTTGLENGGASGDDDDMDEDITKYVLSNVI